MKTLKLASVAAILGAGIVALTATAASAEIVCNGEGECWHVKHHYDYKPDFGLVVHEDNWRWGNDEHYKWHEHTGHGYWHNGAWITL